MAAARNSNGNANNMTDLRLGTAPPPGQPLASTNGRRGSLSSEGSSHVASEPSNASQSPSRRKSRMDGSYSPNGDMHQQDSIASRESQEHSDQGDHLDEEDFINEEINTTTFEEMTLQDGVAEAAADLWRQFLQTAQSQEMAGEALYVAIYEGAPTIQPLFTTPKAVMAMRFITSFQAIVNALASPARLKQAVEVIGFNHLHFDVSVPKVTLVRDAVLDLFSVEVGEGVTTESFNAWRLILNYVGGAIIYVKGKYAERITIILESWKQANEKKSADNQLGSFEEDVHEVAEAVDTAKNRKSKAPGRSSPTETGETVVQSNQVPTTFPDMFQFNAAVMGFGDRQWMREVLSCFHNLVLNVSNSSRLQEECDFLTLRIAKVTRANIAWTEYKSCMLASLRSLLPKAWTTAHEVAWTWFWENVERLLSKSFGQPPLWEAALAKLIHGYDEAQVFSICKDVLVNFFAVCPAGQNFFKQSSTYLHSIMKQIMDFTLELFREPVRMCDEISALGLRHAGYGIATEVFVPFVDTYVKVIDATTKDDLALQAFRWSLSLIAKTLTRNIVEGSTIVMKAINNNSAKQVAKAVCCAPRGERSNWMLLVQVGTQDISPLAWAIESGSIEAAGALIQDLLTIRADRDCYYYGARKLFSRHPDIVRKLCTEAPVLLHGLFDGLVWRSRVVKDGYRRVNYYLKYLLVQTDGTFDQCMEWITDLGDPKIVCHPLIVFLADLAWSKVAYRTFLFNKGWFVLTLIVFIVSQSVLHHLHDNAEKTGGEEWERASIFGCRLFIYGASLPHLLVTHLMKTIRCYRLGNVSKILHVPIPTYIEDKQQLGSFLLMGSLIAMLAMEPIIHCWGYDPHKNFLEYCPAAKNLRVKYTIASMVAVFFYYSLLVDLAVFSNRVSAFVLVCGQMMSEVGLFVLSLSGITLAFASSISIVSKMNEFHGIEQGAASLFKMVLQTFPEEAFDRLHDEPVVLGVVFAFLILTLIFLLNLLVAQLTCAYDSIYEDMVGFARLSRMRIIVETMPGVSTKEWKAFIASMKFDEKLEFNEGDVGLAGGVQVLEPASLNPTTVDSIRRYGGSTSETMPWPEEEDTTNNEADVDRYDRLERFLQKALKKINASARKHRSHGMSSSGSGAGTRESNSNSRSGSHSGSGHD